MSILDFEVKPPKIPETEVEALRPWCGSWTWHEVITGELQQFYCGSMRCSRNRCTNTFWSDRVNRIGNSCRFLHNPPNYPAKFFTLTYPDTLSDEETWARWWYPWNNFRKIVKRKYGSFSYMAILEKHKNNDRPHIHGLTNLFMWQAEWSDRWEAVSGAPVVDIREVTDDSLKDYFGKERGIAKYFGKENMMVQHLEPKRHSIFASRDLTKWEREERENKPDKGTWILERRNLLKKA